MNLNYANTFLITQKQQHITCYIIQLSFRFEFGSSKSRNSICPRKSCKLWISLDLVKVVGLVLVVVPQPQLMVCTVDFLYISLTLAILNIITYQCHLLFVLDEDAPLSTVAPVGPVVGKPSKRKIPPKPKTRDDSDEEGTNYHFVDHIRISADTWRPGSLIYLQWPGMLFPQKRLCVAVGYKSAPRGCAFGMFRRVNVGEDTHRPADKDEPFLRLDLLVCFFFCLLPIHTMPNHCPTIAQPLPNHKQKL